MSGFSKCSTGYTGTSQPKGVTNPSRKAVENSTSPYVYSRRYLDWNRATFEFHAAGSQNPFTFDSEEGLQTSDDITEFRSELGLSSLYGCVPQDYCMTCAPYGDDKNIFTVLKEAMAFAVVNTTREANARYIIANTGSIRFDMYKGPFTFDDSFIVSPFTDIFLYIPDVPNNLASTVLDSLNAGGVNDKRDRFGAIPVERDICVDPLVGGMPAIKARGGQAGRRSAYSGVTRRQVVDLVSGYTTTDDFGTDGDDTAHSEIPYYEVPDYFQATAGFPQGDAPDTVDLIFID